MKLEGRLADYSLTPAVRASFAPDLARRAQPHELPELMDQPCTRADLRACLRDIAWLNRTLQGYRPVLDWLGSLNLRGPVRILDVGSGYGDTLRRVEEWARARGVAVELTGLDLNADAAAIAAEATPKESKIRWVASDVFAWTPAEPPHLVMSSLLAHHLDDAGVVRLLRWMEANATVGWLINDLSRNITPYRLLYAFTRVMRLHPFVRNDGPASIARAFVREDWGRHCAAAGLGGGVEIRGYTPGRLCVMRTKVK